MALVEGIGDEIVLFICALLIIALLWLCWKSTEVDELRFIQRPAFVFNPQNDNIRVYSFIRVQPMNENPTPNEVPINSNIHTNSTLNMDENMNASENASASVNTSTSENDVTKIESTTHSNESSQSTNDAINQPQKCQDSIKIRLKYLNDSVRLVEGKLQENIGVFKRRHFSDELSSNEIVRLIYKGKMMKDDEASLSSCGFHDNCVVHCIIHQQRPLANSQENPGPVDPSTIEQPVQNMINQGQLQPEHLQFEWISLRLIVTYLITFLILYNEDSRNILSSLALSDTLETLPSIYIFIKFIMTSIMICLLFNFTNLIN